MRRMRAPARRRAWRQAAVIAGAIVAVIAMLVAAALIMLGATRPATGSAAASPSVSRQGAPAHAVAFASPGNGVTGTTTLPPEPLDLPLLSTAVTGITPAAPFRLAGASSLDRARALECLSAAIYYEAASESDDGQRAVAQVVLNRVRHPAFPASVCGVVYQGADRTSGCQFSFACDGAMARIPARAGWARAARIAAAALAGQVFAPVGLATHYHTYAVTPAWNRTLVMTDAIGAHFFHRWKGYWGTAAAFRQRYAGREPLPGPPPRGPTPIIALNGPMPVVLPITPATQVHPPYRESGAALEPPSSGDTLPESQILDRWKDSGKPLR
ncbi:cell wall hydrolase [Sphingomonas jeddahensis]|uniref:Cell Wall Hydrolase n=1 Tax=Sphingomonas jeddahensis TaxID=1915074 RepID=A0A1V2ESI1_9SPHN|nr:cell wall hydrolase [Sphingomonas jeddahensis]ONF95540.1 Cell Wall Hydrolase [Sphingomonas jeddahensis]